MILFMVQKWILIKLISYGSLLIQSSSGADSDAFAFIYRRQPTIFVSNRLFRSAIPLKLRNAY